GIVIGNLSIGKNSYEASREWLTHINLYMKQPLQTYQFINEMDKYTANEQNRFETLKTPMNAMQPQQDKHAAPEAYKQLKTYDQTFINDLLKMLDNAYPSSAIMQFSDNKGNSHSVAIAKDERGIWLHDANRYCVYFPNKELGSEEATEHFSAFFNDYHQRNFQHLTKVGLVHFPEQKPTFEKGMQVQKQAIARQQPLILGPGPLHQKTALREAQEVAHSPQPPKPTSRGPKSGF
ncbi:MAG TPA: hypothetical protein PLD88_04665, partial [Candidatus Berkiella sp.]|nr:hypothetical protein [Candidatus Berkiella sp.]